MDVVIPLGSSTASNHIELRYCLRSIEKYVPNLGNVFIVGEKPSWLRSAFHLPEHDQKGWSAKERNIFRKLLKAVGSRLVSDDFLYFNDDMFLLAPWKGDYYFKGTLADSFAGLSDSNYHKRTIANTLAYLGGGYDYDGHAPIEMNKQKFLETVNNASWFIPHGYGIKSLYCNLNEIEGQYYPDLKIHQACNYFSLSNQLQNRRYFSTTDGVTNSDMEHMWEMLYPNKSVYEKD